MLRSAAKNHEDVLVVVDPADYARVLKALEGRLALVRALGEQLGFPMMVKPSRGGSALGASKVSRAEELPAAMVGAFAYGQVAVVERFVTGTVHQYLLNAKVAPGVPVSNADFASGTFVKVNWPEGVTWMKTV